MNGHLFQWQAEINFPVMPSKNLATFQTSVWKIKLIWEHFYWFNFDIRLYYFSSYLATYLKALMSLLCLLSKFLLIPT